MTTLRADAKRWIEARQSKIGHLVTSKRYAPEESWTKDKAWWIQIPLSAVSRGRDIDIVCEAAPGSGEFRHLRVPAQFFEEHAAELSMLGDEKFNLFLAAVEGREFQDLRGPGKLSLARFEVRYPTETSR